MALFNNFFVLFLVSVVPSAIAWPPRNENEYHQKATLKPGSRVSILNVTLVYEISKDTKHLSRDFERKIRKAVESINNVIAKESKKYAIKFNITDLLAFNNAGKSLAKYSRVELSAFLKNGTYFEKLSKNTENTQIIAFGEVSIQHYRYAATRGGGLFGPERIFLVKGFGYEDESHVGQNEVANEKTPRKGPIAVARFKDICSRKSRGIVIDNVGTDENIARLLALNFACAIGMYKKQACERGFVENDYTPSLRSLNWVGNEKKWKQSNHLCKMNKREMAAGGWLRNNISSPLFSHNGLGIITKSKRTYYTTTQQNYVPNVIEDESDSRILVIFISLAAVGALISLGTLGGVCWWIERSKVNRLTKDRVDISYKYEPISRTDTPSIITDPNVNNDLQG